MPNVAKKKNEMDFKEYIRKWKNGEIDGIRKPYYVSRYIVRYLLIKYDNKCGLCGWNERNVFTAKIPLETHHIDGNHFNNREENLILLCPNCHSLTPTYKGLNKGNGRENRKR